MMTSEYGNISWVYFVVGAYGIVGLSLLIFLIQTSRRYNVAIKSLKDEGFFADDQVVRDEIKEG
jgi:hypothetical protein